MKAILFFLLLLFYFHSGNAQNWSSLSPENKTYFNNDRGYLRGIRIDSTKTIGGNTIFYPFLSARVRHNGQGIPFFGHVEDTIGGSWIGKEIINNQEGDFLHLNAWSDTLFIKGSSDIGDIWVLYNDTSSTYYTATIIEADTFTFNNNIDSFKKMSIQVYKDSLLDLTDSLSGLELLLSKNNGFIHALDFYLFPYPHYFENILYGPDYFFSISMGAASLANKAGLVFKRTNYIPPTGFAIYNYSVGDIFKTVFHNSNSFTNFNFEETRYITISSKIITDSSIIYNANYSSEKKWWGQQNSPAPQVSSGVLDFSVDNQLIFDTLIMPEERGQVNIYHYYQDDSSFCTRSPFYSLHNSVIEADGGINNHEPSRYRRSYKATLGEIGNDIYSFPATNTAIYLSYKGNSDKLCNSNNQTVGIKNLNQAALSEINLYPIPANDFVYISSNNTDFKPKLLSVYDASGRLRKEWTAKGKELSLDVTDLLPGIYLLKIIGQESVITRKFTISR